MTAHHVRLVLLAATAAATAIALAPVAGAADITQPAWPSGGFVPAGCGLVTPFAGGVHLADATLPRLRTLGWFVNDVPRGTALVLGPGTTAQVGLGGRITSECSGAGFADQNPVPPETYTAGLVVVVRVGSPLAVSGLVKWPKGTNSWDSIWTSSFVPGMTTANVGRYQPILWRTAPRYQTFDLSPAGALTLGVGSTAADMKWTTPDANAPIYVLRKTTLVETLNATSVRTGRSVRVTGLLKMANGGTYAPAAGARVYLQRRFGTGAWANAGNGLTDASGRILLTYKVLRTTSLRLVHNATLSGHFTAAVTTSAKRVRAT